MAAEQNNTDLRTVVENLVSHRAFRRIASDAAQQSPSGQNVAATTNVLPSPNSGRATFSLPQQDLQSLFRAGGRGRGWVGGGVLFLRLSQFLVQASSAQVVFDHASNLLYGEVIRQT